MSSNPSRTAQTFTRAYEPLGEATYNLKKCKSRESEANWRGMWILFDIFSYLWCFDANLAEEVEKERKSGRRAWRTGWRRATSLGSDQEAANNQTDWSLEVRYSWLPSRLWGWKGVGRGWRNYKLTTSELPGSDSSEEGFNGAGQAICARG